MTIIHGASSVVIAQTQPDMGEPRSTRSSEIGMSWGVFSHSARVRVVNIHDPREICFVNVI